MKLDLLTNATVVDDAIRFVSSQKLSLDNTNEDDKDQLEEEQEEETGEITANQVF